VDTLPSFLLPPTSTNSNAPLTPLAPLTDRERADLARVKRENELTRFESAFERVMEDMEAGKSLSAAIQDHPLPMDYTRFLAWIHRDDKRQERYYAAQTVAAEAVANQMIDIADASDSIEDVQRSTLRINTRKWLLSVWNRKRFGDTKQIEQTVTIDLGQAMIAAQQRVLERQGDVIDVQATVR